MGLRQGFVLYTPVALVTILDPGFEQVKVEYFIFLGRQMFNFTNAILKCFVAKGLRAKVIAPDLQIRHCPLSINF
jgi:hypothetical protein